jgi:hypothetical protein
LVATRRSRLESSWLLRAPESAPNERQDRAGPRQSTRTTRASGPAAATGRRPRRDGIDGNKRLGWVAVRLFHRLNDRDPRAPIDDAFDLVAAIADGSLRDVASIATMLRAWSSELDSTG